MGWRLNLTSVISTNHPKIYWAIYPNPQKEETIIVSIKLPKFKSTPSILCPLGKTIGQITKMLKR